MTPAHWRPSPAWNRRFREALDSAFDDGSIQLLTVDYFAPITFAKIAPAGFGRTFQVRLQELIDQARMEDWLLDLVAAAHERRPKDPALAAIAEDLGLTAGGPRLNNPTGTPLEALIRSNAKFIDPERFRERLSVLEGQVCWVDIPGRGGTGFLVGPDLVLTNQHVIEPVSRGLSRAADVRCRFDYRQPLAGAELERKGTTDVALAEHWLVDSRPPSRYDWEPKLGDAGPEEIDTALIRLAEPIGDTPLGRPSADPEAEPRGWVDALAEPPKLTAGNQVFLLQHPKGEPQQLTIGAVTQFNAAGTRLRYDANSKDGSSGSPCFDADLQLVALHHAHDQAYPPAWNQAVPLATIQHVWQQRGVNVG